MGEQQFCISGMLYKKRRLTFSFFFYNQYKSVAAKLVDRWTTIFISITIEEERKELYMTDANGKRKDMDA